MTDTVKDITHNPLKAVTTGFGAMAGMPAGIFGMAGGGLAGNKLGGMLAGGNKVDAGGPGGPRPEWNLSGADGKLREDLRLNGQMPGAANQSQNVLNTMISRANAVGPTEQAKYLQDANQRGMMNSLGQADATSASGQAKAISNMAMRGGVDSGNRERMAKSFGMDNMMNKQRIMNDANGANLNILAQDEAQKTQMMSALPSQLLGQAGFEQDGKRFDISNTLNTVGTKYGKDMEAWAAMNSAKEQAALANKKDGLFGLGIGGIL